MTLRNTGRKLVACLKYARQKIFLAENWCYLVKFFLAEPLVLSGEVFIIDAQMMLEVVPGPGDDGSPWHHGELGGGGGGWGGGGLVLEAGGGPGGRGQRPPGHGLRLRGVAIHGGSSPGLVTVPRLILARTETRQRSHQVTQTTPLSLTRDHCVTLGLIGLRYHHRIELNCHLLELTHTSPDTVAVVCFKMCEAAKCGAADSDACVVSRTIPG